MPPPATADLRAPAHPCFSYLFAMYGVISLVQPFHRFVAEDMMATLRSTFDSTKLPRKPSEHMVAVPGPCGLGV
nr:unnamed protein product [Digitaria exilis]